jgi:dephospho-CoA kinase
MFAGKPIIGLSGGVGSGKSFIASLFAELGCLVCDADASVRAAYRDPQILSTLRAWWGDSAFLPDGSVNKRALAERIFHDPSDRARLESLIHPYVTADRNRFMEAHKRDENVVAFVWDIPLLFENGLEKQCDWLVFVESRMADRQRRVAQSRHWPPGELERREISQYPLDKKRAQSHDVILNTADDAVTAREQVRAVLSRILAATTKTPRQQNPRPGRN